MFLDTSGLFCRHYRREKRHGLAKRHFENKSKKLTHSYVLSEFVTLCFSRGLPRAATGTAVRSSAFRRFPPKGGTTNYRRLG